LSSCAWISYPRLDDVEMQQLDDAVEDLWDTPASNMSTRDAMEAMGFTEQEIQNEERRDAEKADEVAAREAGRGDGQGQTQAQTGQDAGQTEGLTAPTQADVPADDGIEIQQGRGLIKGKFLADVDGDGVPGGPWETEAQARQAAEAWKQTLAERQTQSAAERARRDSIAEKFRNGGEVTNAEIESLGLKLGSSDVRWFFPTAANLFGLSSRAIRPIVGDLIRTGTTDMGVKREFVPTRQALKAIAKTQADSPLASPTRADVLAQQERQENAEALDQRAQVGREASGFTLQSQTQDNRTDNTGDMFGGPSVDDFQQAVKRNAKPGTVSTGPDLFDATQAEPAPTKDAEQAKHTKIEDSGEVLEGARKLYAKSYAAKLDESTGMETASVPLSKSWPEPDYQRLIEEGADPWAVALARAVRDEIPTKPTKAWKLKGWVAKVEGLRDMAQRVMDGSLTKDRFTEEAGKYRLDEG
jgi:hypothetical protein